MYCHDGRGLGHTARTLAIASALGSNLPTCSILILTDLSMVGRFKFPENVDFVRLPGVQDPSRRDRGSSRLNIDFENTLEIRRQIARSMLKTFKPDVFLVERDPLSLPAEVRECLTEVRHRLPRTRIIWGLPDVVGEPSVVMRDWTRHGAFQTLDELCDEIWIYGARTVFDQVREYRFSRSVADKVHYTGYLRSPALPTDRMPKDLQRLNSRRPVVLITAGGGSRGYPLIANYLEFLERANGSAKFESVVVTGPMMGARDKALLKERARRLPNVIFHRFSRHVLQYLKHSQLVVCPAGYNTVCANLTYRKKSMLVPDAVPPHERLFRARVFDRLGWCGMVPPGELSPDLLEERVTGFFANGNGSGQKLPEVGNLPLDGLNKITDRIVELTGASRSRNGREASGTTDTWSTTRR